MPIAIARIGSDGSSPDVEAVPPNTDDAPAANDGDAAADPDADADAYPADRAAEAAEAAEAAAELANAPVAEPAVDPAVEPDAPLGPLASFGATRGLPGRVIASDCCHDPARGCVTATAAWAATVAALTAPDANESSSAARIDR